MSTRARRGSTVGFLVFVIGTGLSCQLSPFASDSPDPLVVDAMHRVLAGQPPPPEVVRRAFAARIQHAVPPQQTAPPPQARGGGPTDVNVTTNGTAENVSNAAESPSGTTTTNAGTANGTGTSATGGGPNEAPSQATPGATANAQAGATNTQSQPATAQNANGSAQNQGANGEGQTAGAAQPANGETAQTGASQAPEGSATAAASRVWERPEFDLRANDAIAHVTPPSHPGPQPVVMMLDDRCDLRAPACESADTARTYGWFVCVREARACGAPGATAAGKTMVDRTINQISRDAAGQTGTNVLATHGIATFEGVQIATSERGQWPFLMVVDPRVGMAPNFPTTGLRRVAVIDEKAVGRDTPFGAALGRLRDAGVEVGWFLAPHGSAHRSDAERRAMGWLIAGVYEPGCSTTLPVRHVGGGPRACTPAPR